jgi:hypothetical protein
MDTSRSSTHYFSFANSMPLADLTNCTNMCSKIILAREKEESVA